MLVQGDILSVLFETLYQSSQESVECLNFVWYETTVASPREIARVRQKKLPMLRWGWGNHRLFTASSSHW